MSEVIDKTEVQEQTAPQRRISLRDVAQAIWNSDWATKLYALGLFILYAPVLRDAYQLWMEDENSAHGIFIFPVSLALLWLQRDLIAASRKQPSAWGLAIIAFGLVIECFAWLLKIKFFGVWSLIPVLAGSVLLLRGKDLLRITWFPICFLIFAGGMHPRIVTPVSGWLQKESTTGAVLIMSTLGFSISQTGNMIEIPGNTLEVADVCSGFKKTVALIAFASLYAFIFKISWQKRVILLLSALPIALLANIVRVAGLVCVTTFGGTSALHVAHDWAEFVVLIAAFILFVGLGKLLQCKEIRFSF